MLRSLQISHYVLIDSLETTFPEGLVILTGQTGAGKSILLGALSLVLGAKADASVISEGADSCVVEADFSVSDSDGTVAALLEEHEIDWDGTGLLIRRVVSASGRSRSFINDCPVPVQVLSALSGTLVDIHSQHQSLLLADKAFQLSALDRFAGNDAALASCRQGWKRLQDLKGSLAACREKLSRLASERDYKQARFDVLDKARLREGEMDELEQMQRTLANAEQIRATLAGVMQVMDPQEGVSVGAALKESSRMLEKAARFVPFLSELAARLDSSRLEIEDICSEVESAEAGVPSSDRLSEVEERMALIYDLYTKYGCRSEAELIARREEYSRALFDSTALEEEQVRLEKEVAGAEAAFDAACRELTAARSEAAPKFAAEVEKSLRFLELENAVFKVDVCPSQAGPAGADSVSFLFSAAGGAAPADVSKCASGGEISRIMLCLKAMMARRKGMPTMIFDEIDTGVSGSAADKMGQMICRMGLDMQVLAITHLPQVAAQGDAHYLVSREGGRSSVRLLDEEGRTMEIARLLSGSRITPEAVANARILLKESRS